MLARTEIGRDTAPAVAPEFDYSGFPWWHALLVQPGREKRTADRLLDANVPIYLPLYRRQIRCGGKRRRHIDCAVVPGMLFAPIEIMNIPRRRDVLEWSHVRSFLHTTGGYLAKLSKAEIETIRRIEGKLKHPDAPTDSRGDQLKAGQTVRFMDLDHDRNLGLAKVVEIARDNRIGVEVHQLFGRAVKVYVHASEIEVV